MRRANKVKIAPNLVSAARSKHDSANVNEATRSEESASQKTDEQPLLIKKAEPGPSFSRYNSKNKIQPSNPSHTGRTFSTASESEDEVHEEAKSPAKKDNVDTTSTLKGKRLKKKCDEKTPLSIKKAILKRKLASGDHSKLTVRDYIHYNPPDGERSPNKSQKLSMRPKPFEVKVLSKESKVVLNAQSTKNTILDDRLIEENELRMIETENQSKEEVAEDEEGAMPVPQVCLGPDGRIILDEKSLLIDANETKRNKSQLASYAPIVENNTTNVNYGSWRKNPRAESWNKKETAKFFIALQMFGTNFSLMTPYFPGRDRVQLKNKYKKEEKENKEMIDKYLYNPKPFDPTHFMDNPEDSSGDETTSKKDANKSTRGKALKKAKERKTSNEEFEEEIAPPEKKSRKATESRLSTRGRNTASGSR
ncbi:hypothetical protein DAPPUDRAFT_118337 [Daphnia pulex]|uniref:Myb-like domain-containing protein n=1 Tax=Daphnia pulex TaxID=6669 RepID=E9HVG5_DAPPU|nr:hypothetical protein DAPPUDRAFT_118337 [Daphnia pulex]|eukprot:EFX64268.1 hypothetical protein DAPPUDRAFT_118337 [Daphnia pulex]